MNTHDATIKGILAALEVFSGAPNKQAMEQANAWLLEFQHSPDAWSTCNLLLLSPDVPPACRTFAAQTFRTKVTYDLNQVLPEHLFPLRDTLLSALQKYANGPKNVQIQLCLALSGLALQLPEWNMSAVQMMIDSLGQDPSTVPVLLQFLTVLPEEVNHNARIPLSNDVFRERADSLLTANASKVIELLSLYIQAPGITTQVQSQIFQCLRSWLVAGEVAVPALAQTPLFAYAFDALDLEELFESAVDVICDMIHETQEVNDNMSVIELIVPRVIALRGRLAAAVNDAEQMRGYCRIFTEAGETYVQLLFQHLETFFPIVDALAECVAYQDLDIAPITFRFWFQLSNLIGRQASPPPQLVEVYSALVAIIIQHLHFPTDPGSMTAQERDDFRAFRHNIGDTLKDCCHVAGTEACLKQSYDLISAAISRGGAGGNVSWQEIEAPLFSMRSMGAEISPADDSIIPSIMDLIPTLPDHPRVRYSALMVIARYTEWTAMHPQYIPFHLTYISAGFENPDPEVVSAAGSAIKYLCKDCNQHLVAYLDQLHAFLTTVGPKLAQEDKVAIYEAIAYIISGMPMQEAGAALRTFSLNILANLHEAAVKSSPPSAEDIAAVHGSLEQIESMLYVIKTFGDELPPACQNTAVDAWGVFNAVLLKYGDQYQTSERACRVLRLGLQFFGNACIPLLPSVLARMTTAFESSGFACYVWIAGKTVTLFGNDEDLEVRAAFQQTYERMTAKVATILNERALRENPDVMDDYVHLLTPMIEFTPDILLLSPAFPTAFQAVVATLQLVQSEILVAALDFIRIVLSHDALSPPTSLSPQHLIALTPPPKFPLYAAAIKDVVAKQGFELVGHLLTGLVGHFPEDTTSTVVTVLRVMSALWAPQVQAWLPSVVEQLPVATVPVESKAQFLTTFNNAVAERQLDKVKLALTSLHRASLKARDRRRPLDRR